MTSSSSTTVGDVANDANTFWLMFGAILVFCEFYVLFTWACCVAAVFLHRCCCRWMLTFQNFHLFNEGKTFAVQALALCLPTTAG